MKAELIVLLAVLISGITLRLNTLPLSFSERISMYGALSDVVTVSVNKKPACSVGWGRGEDFYCL